MKKIKKNLLQATLWTGIVFTLLSLITPVPFLCVPAFISLYCIIRNLFLSKYLSAFLVAFLYQWSQVSIKVLYATVSFSDITQLTQFPSHIIEAYILSTIALIAMSYGLSFPLRKIKINEEAFEKSLGAIHFNRIMVVYFLMGVIAEGSRMIPGFSQFSVMLTGFKWSLFYLIFIYCFTQKQHRTLLYLIIGYEIFIGFFSYFSSWKTVIFYVLISLFSVMKFRLRHFAGLMIGGCIVGYVALAWTGIKGDYRSFISAGGQQVVSVSRTEAYQKLFELVSKFQLSDKVQKAFIDRMSYIDYFSSCLAYVPEQRPHENGKLLWQAIGHVIKPRLLFPDKAIIDDSSHLTKYTGVFYSNYSMGASFSLGYVADFYIDCGYILMFPALFIWGWVIGKIFQSVFNGANDIVLAVGITAMAFLLLYKFEISMLKQVGNIVVFWVFFRISEIYLFPKTVNYFKKIKV